jgi:hypothetical protein
MTTQVTEFDSVYMIESLGPNEYRTGRNVYDNVLVPFHEKEPWFEVEHFEAADLQSFRQALQTVLERARAGRVPILHIDAHGSRAGIHLVREKEPVRWDEMRETLTAINQATHFRLLVIMAVCKGAYLATILHPPQPAPAWAVIGAKVDIDNIPMEAGMWMQYEVLLNSQDGDASLKALNAEQNDPAQRYHIISAEQMFHQALRRFFQNRTPEIVRQHEDQLVAAAAKKWGCLLGPAAVVGVAAKAREIARRRLSDEKYWYDFWRPRFLMLDRFPENASRFSLTYDDFKTARDQP